MKGDLVKKLEISLPSAFQGYDWNLLYNLSNHGSSLDTLLRKVATEKGTIVFIQTTQGEIFGGFAPVPWKKETSYYGQGEAFVFTCEPDYQCFTWKQTNTMFMLSYEDGIAMGGG
jgi:hypothetical protein